MGRRTYGGEQLETAGEICCANFGLALKDDAIEIGEVALWVYRHQETRGRTGGLVKLQR